MKTTVTALFAVAILALGLAACGSSAGSPSDSASASTGATDEDSSASDAAEPSEGAEAGGSAEEDSATPVSSGPVDATVQVAAPANGDLEFSQMTLHAKAGNDKFVFDNPASVEHNFCIRGATGSNLGCTEDATGGSVSLVVRLQPGKYLYYCNEPGHEKAGMKGTLIVS